jgi:hypothetical protein
MKKISLCIMMKTTRMGKMNSQLCAATGTTRTPIQANELRYQVRIEEASYIYWQETFSSHHEQQIQPEKPLGNMSIHRHENLHHQR